VFVHEDYAGDRAGYGYHLPARSSAFHGSFSNAFLQVRTLLERLEDGREEIMKWSVGDRFCVEPGGGFDEHLWGKHGTVIEICKTVDGRGMIRASMDKPSQHFTVPIVVRVFCSYEDEFDRAVNPI